MDDDKLIRRMSTGDVLDYSIEIFRRNFKQIVKLALIFYIPFMVLYTVAASYLSGELMDFSGLSDYTGSNDTILQFSRFMAYYLSIGALSLVYLIYSITLKPVMDAAIIRITHSHMMTEKVPGIRQVIKEGFSKFTSLLIYRLLFSLIAGGISVAATILAYILLIVIILGTFLSSGTSGGSEPPLAVIIVMIVLIFVLVAGAILAIGYITVKFLFGEQAVIIELKSGVNALGRSSELTKKSFWHIALSYVLGWLLFFMIPQMLSSAAYLLVFVNKDLYVIATAVAQIVNSMLYPFIPILMTVLYINLKIRREGYDLEQQVDILLEEQKKNEEPYSGE